MDFILILIGLIFAVMSISGNRLFLLAKLLLSGITAYWIYTLINPGSYILPISQWENENVISEFISNDFVASTIYLVICYAFFYIVIKYSIRFLFERPLTSFIERALSKLDRAAKRQVLAGFRVGGRWAMRKLIERRIIHPHKYKQDSTKDNMLRVYEVANMIYRLLSVILHVITCFFILKVAPIKSLFIISGILVFLIGLMILYIVMLEVFSKEVNRIITHEISISQEP